MKSLALLVVFLLLIVMISGPIVIILTSRKARTITHNNVIATWIRRGVAIFIGTVSGFISLQLMWGDATVPLKLLATINLTCILYAFRTEWRAAHLS